MTNTTSNTILRRKATVARENHAARSMTPARGLRLAFEKTAEDDLGFALQVSGIERRQVLLGGVLSTLRDDMLLLLLDGPDGAVGAMALDLQVLSALIEVQTIGRVSPRAAPERPMTRTDAAIVMPLVNGALRRFPSLMNQDADGDWADAFQFGARIEDTRSLGLALPAPEYELFDLSMEMAAGARQGQVMLVLPVPPPAQVDATQEECQMVGSPWLEERVLAAPVQLEAILCRISRPLSEVGALKPGKLLKIPASSLHAAALEAGNASHVADASLGQLNGQRALRLTGLTLNGEDPQEMLQVLEGDETAAAALAAQPAQLAAQVLEQPENITVEAADAFDPGATALADGADIAGFLSEDSSGLGALDFESGGGIDTIE